MRKTVTSVFGAVGLLILTQVMSTASSTGWHLACTAWVVAGWAIACYYIEPFHRWLLRLRRMVALLLVGSGGAVLAVAIFVLLGMLSPSPIALRLRLIYSQNDTGMLKQWRLGVYNPGPGSAEKVQVRVISMDPQPAASHGEFIGRFPYRLPTNTNREMGEQTINQRSEEVYDLLHSMFDTGVDRMMIEGVSGWDRARRSCQRGPSSARRAVDFAGTGFGGEC